MHKYPDILRAILEKRGIKNEADAEKFLNPDYDRDLYSPYKMRDMERACVKLFEVVEAKEKTIIYADYDCDGIPGAVVLSDLFKKIGYENYEVYIPHRNEEGYGLNIEAIDGFIEKGVNLIITIDLGITATEEVAYAKSNNIDVIVTDHHLPHEVLPRAFAILNPKVDDYQEKYLCGAGVVFKFVQGFIKKYGEYYKIHNGWEKWSLDMAGLATLSDLVPLLGENRAIAYFGMKVLQKSKRPGFQKLLAKMKIDQRYLTEDDVGFMIAPRLNAASRMDDPMRAYELLYTDDETLSGILSDHLTKINDDRKIMVTSIMREVNKNFEKREMKEVIVVGNPKWRVGVLGLVASRIVENYNKPVFVWGTDENDIIKGSCRSNGEVSLVELMTEVKDFFIDFGGHDGAGGFSVFNDKIHFLEDALSSSFTKVKKEKNKIEAEYDLKADLSIVNMKTWKEIERMAPFGFGNPKPIFLFENVKIAKIRKFGKNGSGEHLEIIFANSKTKAISFFSDADSFSKKISEGVSVDLYATFDFSRWGGKSELRLRVIDII